MSTALAIIENSNLILSDNLGAEVTSACGNQNVIEETALGKAAAHTLEAPQATIDIRSQFPGAKSWDVHPPPELERIDQAAPQFLLSPWS